MKRPTVILIAIFGFLTVRGADFFKTHHSIKWETELRPVQVSGTKTVSLPYFAGASYSEGYDFLPVFLESQPLHYEGEIKVNISNPVYIPLEDKIELSSQYLTAQAGVFSQIGYLRKQPVALITIIPVRKNQFSGQWELLTDFDLEIQVTPTASSARKTSGRNYAPSSVLSSGRWFKVAVGQSGLFKMDYDFLKNLGLDVDNIDPRNIRVYGNGGGMLPEENAEFRHDDLTENPINVVGESDGQFNPGDYVLFYGQSPHTWKVDASIQRFYSEYNIYSEQTFYFVTADLGPGKRFAASPSISDSPNQTVTEFDDRALYESESENFLQSGREWYGDHFDFSISSRNFSFNDFKNLVLTTPVYIKSAFIGRSTTNASTFTFTSNGQTVFTKNVSAICPDYTCPFANETSASGSFTASQDQINLTVTFSNPSSQAEGWMNYIEVNARRRLSFSGSQMLFRDLNSVGSGNKSEFILQNANSGVNILDVTDPVNVKLQQYTLSGGEIHFTVATDTLREFLAYSSGSSFAAPTAAGSVENQNLHGMGQPDMIIVAPSSLFTEAATLASYHRNNDNLDVETVRVDQIYNEFSSGAQDISAIRDFMKMLYDRGGSDTSLWPRYLLMFGDGSYDYKNRVQNNTNLVPVYQSPSSVSVINSYVSDDYFGLLDDNEGGNITNGDLLDIAIGRFPITTSLEAQNLINKIIHYNSTESLGSWRNVVTFVGDDEDGNIHLTQANDLAGFIENNHTEYNVEKLFLDAYPQQSTPGGNRYPDVKEAIKARIYAGTLIMNYTGHGGVNGWAHERILDISDINSWENFDKLALFITATCEFSKFDDPGKTSAGELVLLNPKGGAIAMVTTVRLVYSGANFDLNSKFLQKAFSTYNNRYPTIGEAVMGTKNNTAVPGDINSRKFILLGDPAVTLAYPKYDVVTTQINDPTVIDDTLKALKKMTIKGEVRNNGQKISDFNGFVFPTIFDKPTEVKTLKNDPGSNVTTFKVQKSIIYKGQASVTNGEFSFTFIVPKDISYNYGIGKISYYAHDNSSRDANGYTDVVIGGTATDFEADNTGPELDIFMNDEKFVFGGITDENPLLLVKLSDFSGINTVGTGIGHDITGVLDEDTKNTLVLNEFYEAELDNYQKGKVEYPLSNLEEGRHSMKVKAWDVFNNSAEGYTEFVVSRSADLALNHVLNYPNPFTTHTSFQFEHNRPGEELFVQVKIFTVSGKLIKTIQENVVSDGYRISDIDWDGLDDYGDKIGRGVYIYRVNVRTQDGNSANEFEKLVILR